MRRPCATCGEPAHVRLAGSYAGQWVHTQRPELDGDHPAHGSKQATPRPTGSLLDRLTDGIRVDTAGCWLWTGAHTPEGYGQLSFEGTQDYTHRIIHRLVHGPIPAGWHVDHLCRNPPCCNPAHLEAVTPKENVRRNPAHVGSVTQCRQGHPYDEANTYHDKRGKRQCRKCQAIWSKRYRDNKKRTVMSTTRAPSG